MASAIDATKPTRQQAIASGLVYYYSTRCARHPEEDGRRYRSGRCVACHNAGTTAWYQANKKYAQELTNQWRRDHPEKRRENERNWRNKNYHKVSCAQLQRAARYRAKRKGLPYDLPRGWVESKMGGFCPYCGIKLQFPHEGKVSLKSPSIDEVIPGSGYTEGNSELVCVRCNAVKSNLTLIELKGILENIVDYLENRDG